MVIDRLVTRHPYLATVPDDAPDGRDSDLPPPPPIDWSRAGNIFPVSGVEDDIQAMDEEQRSEDGYEEDEGRSRRNSGDEATWEDWALCVGAEIMAEVRNEVWTRLHYTCSAVGQTYLFFV